jgi:putative MATE family efflux protein
MKSHVTLMTEGCPVRLIVMFALPLMFGNIFQQLYSVVDSMIVGRNLGVSALAALGASSWPLWIMVGMLMGLAQGISILLARLFGQGNERELKRGFGNAIILSAVFSAVLLLIGQLYARGILALLDTPDELIPYAITYLRISISGIPVIMAYNLLSSALRALGDSRTPLYAMIGASVVNIFLDLLFVYVLSWGIGGAAWATVIAQAFSAAVCLKVVLRTSQLHISRSDLTPELRLSREMLILSTPMILQNFLIAGGGMIVQSVANKFSVTFIAGFTAGAKMHGVLEIATSSFGFAMTTYVAQNLGAGRFDRIHSGVRSAFWAAIATACVIAAVMLLLGRTIIHGFVSGTPQEVASTVDVAYRYLAIMCVCLPVLYLLYVFRSSTQGLGNTFLPMISAFAELLMRTGSALILTQIIGETGLFIAEVAAWGGALVVLVISYFYTVHKTERNYLPQSDR